MSRMSQLDYKVKSLLRSEAKTLGALCKVPCNTIEKSKDAQILMHKYNLSFHELTLALNLYLAERLH